MATGGVLLKNGKILVIVRKIPSPFAGVGDLGRRG